jgi:hypothetical protein
MLSAELHDDQRLSCYAVLLLFKGIMMDCTTITPFLREREAKTNLCAMPKITLINPIITRTGKTKKVIVINYSLMNNNENSGKKKCNAYK